MADNDKDFEIIKAAPHHKVAMVPPPLKEAWVDSWLKKRYAQSQKRILCLNEERVLLIYRSTTLC